MKAADLRKMSDEELTKKSKELREELGNLSFHHRIRPLENPVRLRQIRKDIARIATICREKASN
jgi:large subunit ribosomal protein L29